ncbi:cation:proton antiporter domain-containing protein [Phytohabitans suffuscus]|uniref:Cation/H+ exchanger transmembrane domain-containing protein n=1 Tax=Phytohabitans suffuscus TaxID=624315 RepID=A0A6F8YEY0_9ACTN|nr:cation:proton antiporter [Phytohabitans suffuscus]BCB84583.1 hypothetical protein Psuf_018960 [Phytohabitans suffuscus]
MLSQSEKLLTAVLLGIAVVLVVGALLGRLAQRLGQPPVIGEIAAGIMLGPSLLGLLPGDLPAQLFPADARAYLSVISQVGLLLFMFVVGWEFGGHVAAPRRGTAAVVSVSSVVLAFGLGVLLARLLYPNHSVVDGRPVDRTAFCLFLGVAMSITALPVLARILVDTGMLRTGVGALALASAAVDDVLAWCLLALVVAIVTSDGMGEFVATVALAAAYVALLALVVRPLLRAVVPRMLRGASAPYLAVGIAAGVFASAVATTLIGIHAIFGALAFGLVMPREPAAALRERVVTPLRHAGVLLLPLFFVVTGLGVDLGALTGWQWLELVAVLVVACAGKLIGATGSARLCGMPWPEARALGILMNTRGLTELIVLSVGVSLAVLDGPMFTMMVIMALVTTAVAGPLLRARPLPPEEPGVGARPAAAEAVSAS